MPKYIYNCPKCGEIEYIKSMSDPELKECYKCGTDVERVYNPTPTIWRCGGNFGKSE